MQVFTVPGIWSIRGKDPHFLNLSVTNLFSCSIAVIGLSRLNFLGRDLSIRTLNSIKMVDVSLRRMA